MSSDPISENWSPERWPLTEREADSSSSVWPVYEDGAPAGRAHGWRAWNDGHWEAFYGDVIVSGDAPSRAEAEGVAQMRIGMIGASFDEVPA